MDINEFIKGLESNGMKGDILLEGAGKEGWDKIDDDYKDALKGEVSSPEWAYQPDGYNVVVVEGQGGKWSVFSFEGSLSLMKRVDASFIDAATKKALFEADGKYDIAGLGDVGTSGAEKTGDEKGSDSLSNVQVVVKDVKFETALKECVEIVDQGLYKSK